MKVGDTIYMFDQNRRIYSKPPPGAGRIWGDIIYSEHFTPHVITGETRHSWLTGRGEKVNKRTMRSAGRNGFGGCQWHTEDQRAAKIWLNDHRHIVIRLLEQASFEQIKQVAAIIGYDEAAIKRD